MKIIISDRIIFRGEQIEISAEVIKVTEGFLTFKTVRPVERITSCIYIWNERYEAASGKLTYKKFKTDLNKSDFTFVEPSPVINISSGLNDNKIFSHGIDSISISDKFLNTLFFEFRMMFLKIFAFIKNRERILTLYEESGYELLEEIDLEGKNHLRELISKYDSNAEESSRSFTDFRESAESFTNHYIKDSGFIKSNDEEILEDMFNKVASICGYRITKELFFKLIDADGVIKNI